MDIDVQKMSLIERVIGIREESTLKKFEELLTQAGLSSASLSLDDYNKRIDEAEQRVANGQFTTHEDLEKQVKQW